MSSLLTTPISTVIVLIVAIVGGVDLIVNGHLSDDFAQYMAIVGGSSGLLAIGRGLDAHAKP